MFGCFTGGTFYFFVPGMPDEQNIVVLFCETNSLTVHFIHQRAGRINRVQLPVPRGRYNRWRNSVRRKYGYGTFGYFVHFIHKNGTLLFEGFHHVTVVHNLFAHVHRGTVVFESLLNGDHGTINAGAVPAWGGQQYLFGARDGGCSLNIGAASAGARQRRQTEGNGFSGHDYYPTLFVPLVCAYCGAARSERNEFGKNTTQKRDHGRPCTVTCERIQMTCQHGARRID